MKKLTKLTALALALALILGMTAMAGTPSEVLVYDDFSDFEAQDGSLAFTNFDTTQRVKNTVAIKGNNPDAFFTPTTGIYKYFYNSNMTLVNTNGKITIAENSRNDNASPNGGFYYTIPEAWTYEKYGDNSYGLFAQMDWTPVSGAAGKGFYGHQGNIGVVIDTVDDEGNTVATNEIDKYLALNVNADGTAVTTKTADQGNYNNGRSNNAFVPIGEESVIRQIVRAKNKDAQSDCEDRFDTEETLNVFSHLSRGANTYGGNFLHGETVKVGGVVKTQPNISELKGFWFASARYVQNTWGEFVMAKISLDRADFYMETGAIENIVPVDGSIEIVFSQPISTTDAMYGSIGNCANNLPYYQVATGEGEDKVVLTYGEDYEIDVDERIVGTALKGVMTIKPLKGWAFDTTYSITTPQRVMSAMRLSMPAENKKVVTFTTEAAPTFDVTLKAYKGLSDAGSEISALTAGTTYFKVTAAYNSGKVVTNGNVKIEILDADGNVVKSATTARTLTEATTFGAAFKLEAGQSARASIEGGMVGEATIAAAQ